MTSNYVSYFRHRRISGDTYMRYSLPAYVSRRLPEAKDAHILDFGCGFGQFVREMKVRGYTKVVGYDIEPAAIEFCRNQNLPIIDGNQFGLTDDLERYDLIFSSHVIEHIPKDNVIETLDKLRRLLKPSGALLICAPNAQSNTGCYWAYEDFTHYTAYTAGSLYYVLSKAGYSDIEFIDVDCTEGMAPAKRLIKRALLSVYKANYQFWNRVTTSATHAPSPDIFSYEVKAFARGALR